MHSMVAAAAAGTNQPAATAAKIKTASHTEFLTLPEFVAMLTTSVRKLRQHPGGADT
jgi:hypothetical protein